VLQGALLMRVKLTIRNIIKNQLWLKNLIGFNFIFMVPQKDVPFKNIEENNSSDFCRENLTFYKALVSLGSVLMGKIKV